MPPLPIVQIVSKLTPSAYLPLPIPTTVPLDLPFSLSITTLRTTYYDYISFSKQRPRRFPLFLARLPICKLEFDTPQQSHLYPFDRLLDL